MTTANVTVTVSGAGFTIDVTAADLLDDLQILDFQAFHDGNLVSSSLYEKTTPTLLTHVGAALPANTEVEIRRKTPNNVVQSVNFADRVSSDLWNKEFDRVIRWREEADLNGVGELSFVDSVVPNDDPFSAAWDGEITSSASRNTLYDKFILVDGVGSTNATNIAANASLISTNASNIITNANSISTNASSISTNSNNIASNDTEITNIQSVNTTQDGRLTSLENMFASGSWDSRFGISTGVLGTQAPSQNRWYRIGEICHCTAQIEILTVGSSGQSIRLRNLPFNAQFTAVVTGGLFLITAPDGAWSSYGSMSFRTTAGSDNFQLISKLSGANEWSTRGYDFGIRANQVWFMSFSYRVTVP